MAMAWAEDRAPWRHDLSAVPGTKTEEGRQEAALRLTFGIGTKVLNRSYPFRFSITKTAAVSSSSCCQNSMRSLGVEDCGHNPGQRT